MATAFKIQKNVPLGSPGKGCPAKYPFAQMEVGDSFLMPGRHISAAAGTYSHWAQRLGHKYTARTVNDGVRVWRVA